MPLETVKDIMLSLDEYAVVDEDATMLDALVALDEAQARVPKGRHPHRAVLVKDHEGNITGKLGHLAFFAGLEPKYEELGDLSTLSRVGLSPTFMKSMMMDLSLWNMDFDHYARRAMETSVKKVMHPVGEHVEETDRIQEAIHKLVMYQTLSLVVTKDEKPVGILRLADLFPVVAKMIRKRAGTPKGK
jgi:CBS domain-containing protein